MSCWRYCATEVASMAGLSGGALAGTGGEAASPTAAGVGCRSIAGTSFFGAAALAGCGAGASGAAAGSTRRATMVAELGNGCASNSFSVGALSDSTSACSAMDAIAAWTSDRRCSAYGMQCTPQLFRGQRHFQVRHAERIEYGVHHGRHRADRAEFAAALHAEEVGLARHAFVEARAHRRQVRGARHAVVHQRPGEELAALVVHRLLVERLSGALRDAAMHLPFDDHVIDDAPDVVAAREARELHLAGFTIDLHLAG